MPTNTNILLDLLILWVLFDRDVKIQVAGQAAKLRGWKMVRNIDE
jgi:hypothetical protein